MQLLHVDVGTEIFRRPCCNHISAFVDHVEQQQEMKQQYGMAQKPPYTLNECHYDTAVIAFMLMGMQLVRTSSCSSNSNNDRSTHGDRIYQQYHHRSAVFDMVRKMVNIVMVVIMMIVWRHTIVNK